MGKVEQIYKSIEDLNRAELIEHWKSTYGRPPPKHLSTRFMISALAWEQQAMTNGGFTGKIRRQLKILGRDDTKIATTISTLKPGVLLVREWNGRSYQVEVLEHTFRLDGKDYTSLTAIAKKITGAKWSGPRFFGLNGKVGVTHA